MLVCLSCKARNEVGERFCGQCGVFLEEGGPLASPSLRALRSHTPQHLAEKILRSRGTVEGERKRVTVLFADVKGSTELLSERDPEEAGAILDAVIEWMAEAVHCYEGTISQVAGDGIMALFGAPLAHEDHGLRACYAALRMHESMRCYGAETRHAYGIEVQIRIGLNSGEVVVSSIGDDSHMNYTAVGATVHLAARMEQTASPGTIRITDNVARLVEGQIDMKPLGPIPVKGLVHPVEAFEVMGAGSLRTRFQASAARGLASFVGRDHELAELERALDRAREGCGQVVALVGEAGVGKSRLIHEFARLPGTTEKARVLACASVSCGRSTSYMPAIDLLKDYFQIVQGDNHSSIRRKVSTVVAALGGALDAMVTPLLALLDVPVDEDWQALDPPRRRQRMHDAMKGLLLRESRAKPLVVVFEDLHWIDAQMQALLDGLVEGLQAAPLLLLVSYRPEYRHEWASKALYTQHRLTCLSPEDARVLLRDLLGNDPSVEALKSALAERTAGNPLFLEESIRSLVQTGVLEGSRGAYRLVRSSEAIDIPATAQAILAARIDRLAAEDKQLLQSAAVIAMSGNEVPLTLLREIADEPGEVLRARLDRLQAAELLFEATLFPDLEYAFQHALTHETAYAGILHKRRRTLHAAVVEAIERLHPNRLPEHFERLAHHSLNGECWDKAVRYLHAAAHKAGSRSAYREAATCYDEALAALAHLPDGRAKLELGLSLRFEANFGLLPLGELSRAIQLLEEAEPLAESLGDRRRLARLLAQIGDGLWARGAYDAAIEAVGRAQRIALTIDERRVQINVARLVEFRTGIDGLSSALKLLDEEKLSVRSRTFYGVYLRVGLGLSLAPLGRFGEALRTTMEAREIAESTGDLHDLSIAYHAAGLVHVQKGEYEPAIRILERGRDICERGSLGVILKVLAVDLGGAYAQYGRAEEAIRVIEEALRRASDVQVFAGDWQTKLAEAHLCAGKFEEAREIARGALELSRSIGQRSAEAQCLHLLGDIESAGQVGQPETVEEIYREAMVRSEALGMRPLVARCHFSLARLARTTGKLARSREHLDAAASLFREMDMGFWLEKAAGWDVMHS
jgi:class 3 adenylate cyclase/tetratricopeptide (TPR) repeat protein